MCEQMIKKSKGKVGPLVLALKAVALDRMDRHAEAVGLCLEVAAEHPDLTDDSGPYLGFGLGLITVASHYSLSIH